MPLGMFSNLLTSYGGAHGTDEDPSHYFDLLKCPLGPLMAGRIVTGPVRCNGAACPSREQRHHSPGLQTANFGGI